MKGTNLNFYPSLQGTLWSFVSRAPFPQHFVSGSKGGYQPDSISTSLLARALCHRVSSDTLILSASPAPRRR